MNRRQAFKNLFTLAVAPVAISKALAEMPVKEITVVKEAMVDLSTFRPRAYFYVSPEMLDDIPYLQSYIDNL